MAVIKIILEERLKAGPVIVELGCGPNPQAGRIGVDRLDLPGVSVVADLDKGLSFLPDNSVDEMISNSFLEHVENFDLLMKEIVRVLKPGGKKKLFVPHFSNPYFYSDPTHSRFFGLYSFFYYVPVEHQLRRKVPTFYSDTRIKITDLKLVFTSPFRERRWFKKLVGKVVNLNGWTQEFYEENFSQIVPCYGINLTFEPIK